MISADASVVAFQTLSGNLLQDSPPPCNGSSEVLLRNMISGASQREKKFLVRDVTRDELREVIGKALADQ